MAWTAPMTAVENEIWTSAQFNTHVRDNLNETEAAKISAAGQYIVSTGANAVAARAVGQASVNGAAETTASTTYTNLTTSGPAVTATTGTSALVHIAANMSVGTANAETYASYAVSGATTSGSSDARAIRNDGVGASEPIRAGVWNLHTGLNAGSNTFTMQYRVSAGTGSFLSRHIIVVPL